MEKQQSEKGGIKILVNQRKEILQYQVDSMHNFIQHVLGAIEDNSIDQLKIALEGMSKCKHTIVFHKNGKTANLFTPLKAHR
ncbi:hypothetical protein [Lewinella cohaerens]|uniref:hypothetical protein n=1 Tax=Lewinella cohaerens TaxID=70995 RepID=UPI00036B01B9|nr:hypothetical protein [Lewinella cohaerens]